MGLWSAGSGWLLLAGDWENLVLGLPSSSRLASAASCGGSRVPREDRCVQGLLRPEAELAQQHLCHVLGQSKPQGCPRLEEWRLCLRSWWEEPQRNGERSKWKPYLQFARHTMMDWGTLHYATHMTKYWLYFSHSGKDGSIWNSVSGAEC